MKRILFVLISILCFADLKPEAIGFSEGFEGPTSGTMNRVWCLASSSMAKFSLSQQFQSPNSDYSLSDSTNLTGDKFSFNDQPWGSNKYPDVALDVAVVLVQSYPDSTPFSLHNVKIRIKNVGTSPLSSCDVQYSINLTNFFIETWTPTTPLVQGDTAEYTFIQKYRIPVGFYQLCAQSLLINDANTTNDRICQALPNIPIGFEEHLENGIKLWQNAPNPADGSTKVDFEIPSSGHIRFELIDVLGQSVMLIEEKKAAGHHHINISLIDLSPGIYYYKLEFNGSLRTKKMVVNR